MDKYKKAIIGINRKHRYFFKVQGQLRVTNRKHCLFALWNLKGIIHFERIERDDFFLEVLHGGNKLKKIYYDCILPEIVDARLTRSMVIRDSPYILEVQKALKTKRERTRSA